MSKALVMLAVFSFVLSPVFTHAQRARTTTTTNAVTTTTNSQVATISKK